MLKLLLLLAATTGIMLTENRINIGTRCPNFRRFSFVLNRMPNLEAIPHPCRPDNDQARDCEKINWLFLKDDSSFSTFYTDFQKILEWAPIFCRMDSDGDGRSNGEELGDPRCEWIKGMHSKIISSPKSHPAICEPVDSQKCIELNNKTFCKIEKAIYPLKDDAMKIDNKNDSLNNSLTHSLSNLLIQKKIFEELESTPRQQNHLISTDSPFLKDQLFTDASTPLSAQQETWTPHKLTWQDVTCQQMNVIFNERGCNLHLVEQFLEQDYFEKRVVECWTYISANETNSCAWMVEYLIQNIPKIRQAYSTPSSAQQPNTDSFQKFTNSLRTASNIDSIEINNVGASNVDNVTPPATDRWTPNFGYFNKPIEDDLKSISGVVTASKIEIQNYLNYTSGEDEFLHENFATITEDKLSMDNIYMNVINILNNTISKLNDNRSDYEYRFLIDDAFKQLNVSFNVLDKKLVLISDFENILDKQNTLNLLFEKYWSLFKQTVDDFYLNNPISSAVYKILLKSTETEIISLQVSGLQNILSFFERNDSKMEIPTWDVFISSLNDMNLAAEEYQQNTKAFFENMESEEDSCIEEVNIKSLKSCEEIYYSFQVLQFINFVIRVKDCWRTVVYHIETTCFPEPFDLYYDPQKFNVIKKFFKKETDSILITVTGKPHEFLYTLFDSNAAIFLQNDSEKIPIEILPNANGEFWDEIPTNESSSDNLGNDDPEIMYHSNWWPKQDNNPETGEGLNMSASYNQSLKLDGFQHDKQSNSSMFNNFVSSDNQTIHSVDLEGNDPELNDTVLIQIRKISSAVNLRIRFGDISLLILFYVIRYMLC